MRVFPSFARFCKELPFSIEVSRQWRPKSNKSLHILTFLYSSSIQMPLGCQLGCQKAKSFMNDANTIFLEVELPPDEPPPPPGIDLPSFFFFTPSILENAFPRRSASPVFAGAFISWITLLILFTTFLWILETMFILSWSSQPSWSEASQEIRYSSRVLPAYLDTARSGFRCLLYLMFSCTSSVLSIISSVQIPLLNYNKHLHSYIH